MARVVVIDPDPRIRRRLAELLRPMGHTVDLFGGAAMALAGWGTEEPALVLAALGPGGALAEEVWDTMETLGARRVVWTGPVQASALALLNGGKGHGFLQTPPTAPAVAGLFSSGGAPASGPSWSGLEALERVDGSASRFPLLRVLFLAHRVAATGRLEVSGRGQTWAVGVQAGRVVAWSGLPGLLAGELGSDGAGGPDDLMGQLGQAIGQGTPPDRAMEAAGRALGRKVAAALEQDGLHARWVDGSWGEGAPMPLPTPLPTLLAHGLAASRGPVAVRRTFAAQRKSGVRATPPNDAPESQWRLPPAALRFVREAGRADTLGDLMAAVGGESDATWRALDLVVQLGLVAIAPAEPGPRRRTAPPSGAASAPAPAPADDRDPDIVRLKEALTRFRTAEPHAVLGVETADDASVEGLDALFLERSAEYHPDRLAGASPEVKRLSELCFTRIADAREALRDSDRRIELVERLRAAEAGVAWASADDKRRAVLIGKQGEIALKRGAYDEAWPLLDEARTTDPTEFRYTFHALHAGWRAGALPPAEVVEALLALDQLTRGQAGDVYALAGEILLREELDEERGYSLLEKAVECNAELVDAKRRLRLRDMRQRKEAETSRQQSGTGLRGLLRWGRKGSDGA